MICIAIQGIAQDELLFPIGKKRTAEVLKADLIDAGIDPGNENEVVDFHRLRQTFITNLSLAGVTPQMAMRLARHSDVNLTLNTYTQIGIGDRKNAVESLPNLGASIQKLAPQLALKPDSEGQNEALCGTTKPAEPSA